MPKNKLQGAVFGLIMSYVMAMGMEVYNMALKARIQALPGGLSGMTYGVWGEALKEAAYMGLIVFVVSNLWGNRMGACFAAKVSDPQRDNPYFCQLMRQAGTVAVMCPTMSLVASILYRVVLGGAPVVQLPVIWVGTVLKNFPMAFFWNMFAAAPFTRWLFGWLFRV